MLELFIKSIPVCIFILSTFFLIRYSDKRDEKMFQRKVSYVLDEMQKRNLI